MSDLDERRAFLPEDAQIKEPELAPEPVVRLTEREELMQLEVAELADRILTKNKQLAAAAKALHMIHGRTPFPGAVTRRYCCPKGNEFAAFALKAMRDEGDFPGSNLGKQ